MNNLEVLAYLQHYFPEKGILGVETVSPVRNDDTFSVNYTRKLGWDERMKEVTGFGYGMTEDNCTINKYHFDLFLTERGNVKWG